MTKAEPGGSAFVIGISFEDSLGGCGFGRKKNLGIFVAGVPEMGMSLI
jgi:hypothetical protein